VNTADEIDKVHNDNEDDNKNKLTFTGIQQPAGQKQVQNHH
jgi:hypothetical protein